jgi:hypothetical protein
MADFASLLGQLQQSAQHLADRTGTSKTDAEPEQPPRKRVRQLDAKDFAPVEKVFLICPAGVQTGGPEALHQLCDQLNESTNIPAYMLYVVGDGGAVTFASRAKTPVPYRHYNAPAVSYDALQQGHASHLFLWPECWTDEMMDYLEHGESDPTPCAIWWLSVNNNTARFKAWSRKDIIHLYQSEYAKQHLIANGATHIYEMTEYISNPPVPDESIERSIDVLFNPLKGVHYTDEIRKRSDAVMQFRPIGEGPGGHIRISPEQVRELLQRAKIYIDFGPHPGMDRLPREAALAGCLVVTNREGAAFYDQDVPLPSKYKVHNFDPDTIHKLLKDLLDNQQERSKDLDEYRTWIGGQRERMKTCVANLVTELVTKRAKSIG